MSQFAFTIMSFGDAMQHIYQEAISPAIQSFGIECRRVDQLELVSERITDRIQKDIRKAYFVVAELSGERPNCYYELGYARALQRPAVLLIDETKEIPFDVQDFSFITYRDVAELRAKLTNRILEGVLKNGDRESAEDLRCGRFGRYAFRSGRLLSATVDPDDGEEYCNVWLTVTSAPGSPPLAGRVRFYLHDSYDPTSRTVEVRNGEARCSSVPMNISRSVRRLTMTRLFSNSTSGVFLAGIQASIHGTKVTRRSDSGSVGCKQVLRLQRAPVAGWTTGAVAVAVNYCGKLQAQVGQAMHSRTISRPTPPGSSTKRSFALPRSDLRMTRLAFGRNGYFFCRVSRIARWARTPEPTAHKQSWQRYIPKSQFRTVGWLMAGSIQGTRIMTSANGCAMRNGADENGKN